MNRREEFFTEEFYLIYVDSPSQQEMELNSNLPPETAGHMVPCFQRIQYGRKKTVT